MRLLLLLFTAFTLHAHTTLLSLIESAQHNEQLESLNEHTNAAQLQYQATKNSYLPRIDALANGSLVSPSGGFDAAQNYSAGLRGEYVIFDGFKRENKLDQTKALENAAKYRHSAGKKEISLDIIQRYFELQNTLEEIHTYSLVKDQLQAQLSRLEKFLSAGLASEDALMRIRSAFSNAQYQLEDLRYQRDRQTTDLETMTNQTLGTLTPVSVREPTVFKNDELDSIKALKYSRDATTYQARQSDSGFLPTLTVFDQYTVSHYVDDPIAVMRVNNQNKLSMSLSLNLVDFSAASTAKQALIAQSHAQTLELNYAAKESAANLSMASRSIERSRALILSAQSAFDSSQKTFNAVTQKYEARIVDYVTYLDALRSLTDSTNQLSRAKRSLNYAYATYYYYAGLDPKEFVQ
ncbi:MAG: TolC family protein [Sulfuricurvum sp.]